MTPAEQLRVSLDDLIAEMDAFRLASIGTRATRIEFHSDSDLDRWLTYEGIERVPASTMVTNGLPVSGVFGGIPVVVNPEWPHPYPKIVRELT